MDEELFSMYIGPQAENIELLKELIIKVLDNHAEWRRSFYKEDRLLYKAKHDVSKKLLEELDAFLERSRNNLPYFHPRYVAQMLKDPSVPTILGYLNFMLSNPNNHAYEGGPVTTEMEMEVVDLLLKKLIQFNSGWGHLTSGGSLANLEALWVARDYKTDGYVYFSEASHYSWKRICRILRIEKYREIPVDRNFRMDINVLEDELKKNPAFFVMANLGSTGTGSVDDISAILKLKEKYNFHLHVDAAYGGFIKSVMLNEDYSISPYHPSLNIDEFVYNQFKALAFADSLTIDPHKHGLISYGAGAVLFRDEKLKEIVLNTAPYTYHKLDKPNIGMFSLEGSRPGAMAAACYLTYKVLPPNRNGLGKIIRNSLAASSEFYKEVSQMKELINLNNPDLDINCFYKASESNSISDANAKTLELYRKLSVEATEPPVILSKFITSDSYTRKFLSKYKNPNNENLITLRAVFIKHWNALEDFYYLKELIKELH